MMLKRSLTLMMTGKGKSIVPLVMAFQSRKTLTVEEIGRIVDPKYVSNRVSRLRDLGMNIHSNREGKKVRSYTLIEQEPASPPLDLKPSFVQQNYQVDPDFDFFWIDELV